MSETVKITASSKTTTEVYHTEDCRKVKETKELKQIDRDVAEARYDECQYCSGEYDNSPGEQDRHLYRKLREMGKANDD